MGALALETSAGGSLINSKTQQSFKLKNGMTLGRSKTATISFESSKVSRIHLTIFLDEEGNVSVEDSSTNGTYLDGKKISGKVAVTKNSTIKLGDEQFNLVLPHSTTANSKERSPEKSRPLKLLKNFSESYDDYPAASTFKRFVSVGIDNVILNIMFKIPAVLLPKLKLPDLQTAIVLICSYILITLSYYYFSLNKSGQTIGKRAMKLKIITTDGSKKFSVLKIFSRELLKAFLGFVSIFTINFTKKKLAVHDMGAKTRVIDVSGR